MIRKRDLLTVILFSFCLVSVLFSFIGTNSSLPYDPWADINDDGKIDMKDIGYVARLFGVEGTPTNKTELLLELQAKINSLNASLLELQSRVDMLENAAQRNVTIWSGGSSTSGTSTGWNTYLTDFVEFNTAQDYLTVLANGTVTVLIPGYYRIDAWAMMFGMTYDGMAQLVVNGSNIYNSQDRRSSNQWFTLGLDVIWRLNPGDIFYVRYYNPGQYAYYRCQGSPVGSRLQVTYVGPL
jgi:hypothetical protein